MVVTPERDRPAHDPPHATGCPATPPSSTAAPPARTARTTTPSSVRASRRTPTSSSTCASRTASTSAPPACRNGITNSLHLHFTAEVFINFGGDFRLRWGAGRQPGRVRQRRRRRRSRVPTWIFRGFTNEGPDDGILLTVLGHDDTGGIIWGPSVLRGGRGVRAVPDRRQPADRHRRRRRACPTACALIKPMHAGRDRRARRLHRRGVPRPGRPRRRPGLGRRAVPVLGAARRRRRARAR